MVLNPRDAVRWYIWYSSVWIFRIYQGVLGTFSMSIRKGQAWYSSLWAYITKIHGMLGMLAIHTSNTMVCLAYFGIAVSFRTVGALPTMQLKSRKLFVRYVTSSSTSCELNRTSPINIPACSVAYRHSQVPVHLLSVGALPQPCLGALQPSTAACR